MRHLFILFVLFIVNFGTGQIVHPPNNQGFLQDEVASIYIDLPSAQLDLLLGDSLYSDHEFLAQFSYQSTNFSLSLNQVGFRVRGNTSRNAGKKSFNIDFNEYVPGQKFLDVDNMNLLGNHNDPSQLRAWLSGKILQDSELPASRNSFIKLFINSEYKGLYLNNEAIDDEFIKSRFITNDGGNLYKCIWGADLSYQGTNPLAYSSVYELKTNKTINDYSGLIHFLEVLYSSSISEFPCRIQEVFDVDLYLKTLVYEILIGHWDGYAGNKNNYYLYQRPSDGKFVFIEYDMDNTFGIDWFSIDWSTRNINNWQIGNRPLIQRLFSVPYFEDRFNFYMQEALNSVFTGNLIQELESKQTLIQQAAFEDIYKELDYEFTDQDFLNAIHTTFGNHVTNNFSDYISTRIQTATNQLAIYQGIENPCTLSINEIEEKVEVIERVDLLGRKINEKPLSNQVIIEILSNGKTRKTFSVD
ncbi:MAG: CotH kinase family protein [Bacteroidota bacterium]